MIPNLQRSPAGQCNQGSSDYSNHKNVRDTIHSNSDGFSNAMPSSSSSPNYCISSRISGCSGPENGNRRRLPVSKKYNSNSALLRSLTLNATGRDIDTRGGPDAHNACKDRHQSAPKRVTSTSLQPSSLQRASRLPKSSAAESCGGSTGVASAWVDTAISNMPNMPSSLRFSGDRCFQGRTSSQGSGQSGAQKNARGALNSRAIEAPPKKGNTTNKSSRWIPYKLANQLPSLPSMPSLSSIQYLTEGTHRNDLEDQSLEPFDEPFEHVPCSDCSDDSTGTTVHGVYPHTRDSSPQAGRHHCTSREDDSFFLIFDAAEVSSDDAYDHHKWQRPPPSPRTRGAQFLGEGARRARNTATKVGQTVAKVGENVMEAARMGAEVARAGAYVGGAIMAANAHDMMTDMVRNASVWGARNRLQYYDEEPEVGEEVGQGTEFSNSDGPYRPSPYNDDESQGSELSEDDVVVTEGLRVLNQEQEVLSSKGNSSSDQFFNTGDKEGSSSRFCDVDLKSSGRIETTEDYEEISDEMIYRPIYFLEDIGPHVRRRLGTIHPARPRILVNSRGTSAALRRAPSPFSSGIAFVSEGVDQLPRSNSHGPGA